MPRVPDVLVDDDEEVDVTDWSLSLSLSPFRSPVVSVLYTFRSDEEQSRKT